MKTYIVNVSGGLTSYEALRRTIAAVGQEHTVALFADTKGDSTEEHAGEDEDTYRFNADVAMLLRIPIIRVADGRDIWQVFKDRRYINMRVGAGQLAACSQELKRKAIDKWIDARYLPSEIVRVFGMEWSEASRMDRLREQLAPCEVWFPLAEPPYVDKCHIAAELERQGVAAPRLYALGFEHNNCGGGCVKAGQAHFARLWQTMPDRYLYWERKEAEVGEYLGKDVSILKDRRGGVTVPMSLATFRARLEAGGDYDRLDFGGCGCFAQSPQLRMDDLLLEAEVARA